MILKDNETLQNENFRVTFSILITLSSLFSQVHLLVCLDDVEEIGMQEQPNLPVLKDLYDSEQILA